MSKLGEVSALSTDVIKVILQLIYIYYKKSLRKIIRKIKLGDVMKSHSEIYLHLLQTEHFDQVQQLMKEQNVHEVLKVKSVSLEQRDGFPYLLFQINSDQIFAAQMVGLFLNISSILSEYDEGYYFPVIAMCDSYEEEIQM